MSELLGQPSITGTTYGTWAVIELPRAHDVATTRLLTSHACHLLSETSTMHGCGLGSLAGAFREVLTAGYAYYCFHSWAPL